MFAVSKKAVSLWKVGVGEKGLNHFLHLSALRRKCDS